MVTLTIDGRTVQADPGTTILAAARGAGIRIPTLCHVEGYEASASCFLCAVQIEGRSTLSPACAMPVADGMVVHTSSDEVRASRKMALELLFSDHVGDCIGPCRTGCPARLDIPGFISLLSNESYRRSAEVVFDDLTLPASLGRICPRLCEQRCRRCDLDESLAIGRLHRFVADADLATASPYVPGRAAPTGKNVAIVGAGPAGLAAAMNLLRRGHAAVLFDAHAEPGGMLRYGVPEFRLPRQVLDSEIGVIRALGGEFRMNQRLGVDFTLAELRQKYDAVFLGIGAQGSRGLGCPGDELALPAIQFLDSVANGRAPDIGREVVVIGGGNSAMDAARTAIRFGARVRVLYRRTQREMPCLMAEVEAALAEGVVLDTLVAPLDLARSDTGSLRLTCQRMELGSPDASGRPRPVPVPNSLLVVDASCVISAIGQTVDTSPFESSGLARSAQGIEADPLTLATNLDGVFAGGDAVTGADVAVRAVAAGKLAAASIDQHLRGQPVVGHPELINILMGALSEAELADLFREIEKAPRRPLPELSPETRTRTFEEVEQGLPRDEALAESRRCLQCGCGKAPTCRLRQYGTEYGADPERFAGDRRQFHRDTSHAEIVFEPGKCILCGACIKVAAEAHEPLGLAWIGRGFEATVGVSLGATLSEGLCTAARRAAGVCPTGAFALTPSASTTRPLEFRRSRS